MSERGDFCLASCANGLKWREAQGTAKRQVFGRPSLWVLSLGRARESASHALTAVCDDGKRQAGEKANSGFKTSDRSPMRSDIQVIEKK